MWHLHRCIKTTVKLGEQATQLYISMCFLCLFKKDIFCPFSPYVEGLIVTLASKAVFHEEEGTYANYVLFSLPNSVHLGNVFFEGAMAQSYLKG